MTGQTKIGWSGVQAEIDPYKYCSWPMNASVQAWRLTGVVEGRLAALQKAGRASELPPVLAVQSAVDSTGERRLSTDQPARAGCSMTSVRGVSSVFRIV